MKSQEGPFTGRHANIPKRELSLPYDPTNSNPEPQTLVNPASKSLLEGP